MHDFRLEGTHIGAFSLSASRLWDLWMAYDEALAQRIRDLAASAGAQQLTEKKMFGGLDGLS
jgi:hypothetical protein